MKPTIQELITLYNNTESRIERANLWSHIEEKIEEISFEHNSDNDYSGSLYFTDEDALNLSNERVAYQRGYIQALNDLILRQYGNTNKERHPQEVGEASR